MSPLAALLAAMRAGNTLPWLLVHCPDGDREAALRRAWAEERTPARLHQVAVAVGSAFRKRGGVYASGTNQVLAHGNCPERLRRRQALDRHNRGHCMWCCRVTRAVVACPAWDEIPAS